MQNVSPVLIASEDARLVNTNMMMSAASCEDEHDDLIASGDARLVKTNMMMPDLIASGDARPACHPLSSTKRTAGTLMSRTAVNLQRAAGGGTSFVGAKAPELPAWPAQSLLTILGSWPVKE